MEKEHVRSSDNQQRRGEQLMIVKLYRPIVGRGWIVYNGTASNMGASCRQHEALPAIIFYEIANQEGPQ